MEFRDMNFQDVGLHIVEVHSVSTRHRVISHEAYY
jgi:hypothetical protein